MNSLIITQLNEELESFFSNDSLKNLDVRYLEEEIQKKTKEIFNSIQLSLLRGEYIDNEFNSSVEKFFSIIDVFYQRPFEEPTSPNFSIIENWHCFITRSMKPELLVFLESSKKRFEFGEYAVFLGGASKDLVSDLFYEKRFNEFIAVIELVKFNLNIDISANCFESLLKLRHRIAESELPYRDLLVQNCNFLLKKLKDELGDDTTHNQYIYNYSHIDVHDLAYDLFTCFELNSTTITQLYNKRLTQKLLYSEYYQIVKAEKERLQLDELIQTVDNFKQEHCNELGYDKHAFKVSYNYILNNLISVSISENSSVNNFSDCLQKIKQSQQTSQVFNYFPYFKISKKIVSILESDLTQHVKKEQQDLFNLLKDQKETLYGNFNWSRQNLSIAYKIPYNECVKSISFQSINYEIFIASSFVAPINYEKVKLEIVDIEGFIRKYQMLLDVHKTLRTDLKNIDIAVTEAKSAKIDVEKSQTRTIEILSIFAAIVLFVSGDIQIFNKAQTLGSALLFMVIFAFALSAFVLIIHFITRPNRYNEIPTSTKISGGMIVLLLILSLFLYFQKGDEPINYPSKLRDSLSKEIKLLRTSIDSMKKLQNTVSPPNVIKDTTKH